MERYTVEQKYKIDQVVLHYERAARINAFRYEVRPGGVSKIYECTYECSKAEFSTIEEMINIES